MKDLNFLVKLAPAAKAVAAFLALLIPFLTALVIVINDLVNGHLESEHLTMLLASLVALVGGTKTVYQVTNAPKNVGTK